MPITLPFPPTGMEYDGAMPNVGALQQLIGALGQNAAPFKGNFDLYADATATGITYTAAGVLKGIIRRSGGAGITDTTPTAALLYAAWPGCAVGNTALILLTNLNSGTITIGAGTDVTLAGTTTVVTVAARLYVLSVTAAPVAITGMSYANGVVNVTTNLPHGLAAGGTAIVANMVNAAFNGSFTVASSPAPTAYTFSYPLAAATAFATDSTVPNPSPGRPALLNTAPTMTLTGCFSWPATMIV